MRHVSKPKSNFYLFLLACAISSGACTELRTSRVDGSTDVANGLLLQMEQDGRHFVREIDIDRDGIPDKVVSSNPNSGDDLYFFRKTGNSYELVLTGTNFSEDGGRVIDDIVALRADNLVVDIRTSFPKELNSADYFVAYEHGTWVLKQTTYRISDWRNNSNAITVCDVKQGIAMSEILTSPDKLKQLPDEAVRERGCKVVDPSKKM